MSILKITNLSVQTRDTGKKIIHNLSLTIEKKSIHLLIGPNGSGKSTLAASLMGLPRFKIVSGKIVYRGKDITHLPPEKRARLGLTLAFQEPAYFEGVKVKDFLQISKRKADIEDLKEACRFRTRSLFKQGDVNKSERGREKKD